MWKNLAFYIFFDLNNVFTKDMSVPLASGVDTV